MNYFSRIEEWEQLMILSAVNRIAQMMSTDAIEVPEMQIPEQKQAS